MFFYLIFSFNLLLSPSLLWATDQKVFKAENFQSILIKVPYLDLKFEHKNSSNYTVEWTGKLSTRVDKNTLLLKSPDFDSIKLWSKQQKPVILKISGPSRPLQLFSFSSKISSKSWKESVFISSLKGELNATNSQGSWKMSLKEGTVNIYQQKGSLEVQAFQLKSLIKSSEGNFQFYMNEGSLRVKNSKGKAEFITDKANVRLTQFKGSLKGSSQSGNIKASLQADKVELFAKESILQISTFKHAARITAYTESGKIYGSRHFHKQFSGKSTKVTGRVKGSVKKGLISLKTESGNIYIN